ncbi:hypothetical protein QUF74_05130 [Candidatus Halobeggiatoa sp. HSG11]|nr:hypothetical protein [Candidatus Halobeggiatoa sp. HSG11]
MKQIVSNTGPLISLEKIPNGFELIRRSYDQIIIPTSVLLELTEGITPEKQSYLEYYQIKDLITVISVGILDNIPEKHYLDIGELEAISLAFKLNYQLLIEEKHGRRIAKKMGLEISGIAGQVMKLFHENKISSIEALSYLEALYQHFRINKIIYEGLKIQILKESK